MICIDSNIFIYAALRHPDFGEACKKLLLKIEHNSLEAAISALALCEVHNEVRKYIGKEAAELSLQAIFSYPLKILSLDSIIFQSALNQVREHNLKINDAVHLATALALNAGAIYSYDRDFDNLEIPRIEPK